MVIRLLAARQGCIWSDWNQLTVAVGARQQVPPAPTFDFDIEVAWHVRQSTSERLTALSFARRISAFREETKMAHKQVLFRSEAREKLLRGATALADAVRVTLGPKSKCVLIQRSFGIPLVCNDGVTIAREMDLKDASENLGVQMIRQAAERTGDAVGDGTSTATLLAHAIFADGLRNVVAGASAIDIKRGLDRGVTVAVQSLKALSRPVKSRLEKSQIAAISAHNDSVIGNLVADAMERVGDEGVITVEESKTTETALEVVEGLQFDRGYLSPYFVTDPEKMEASLEEAIHPSHRQEDHNHEGLCPDPRADCTNRASFLMVAEEVEGEALATLVVNKLRGSLHCVAVKAPGLAIGARRCWKISRLSPAEPSSRRSWVLSSRSFSYRRWGGPSG